MQNIKEKEEIIREERKHKDGITYIYRLYVVHSKRVSSYGIMLYKINIVMIMPDGSSSECDTKEVFSDPGKAFAFYKKLTDNLATPLDLPYIVEDELMR